MDAQQTHGVVMLTVSAEEGGSRLDRLLAERLAGLSRSRLQGLIRAGCVEVAGRTISEAGHRVKQGDTITVAVPPPEPAEPEGEHMALSVVFEDEALIVIDKPAGLVVHPAAGHATGTLVNALIAHCGASLSGIGGVRRPGIVHRLDKDTSGLLVVAKTDAAHRALSAQFAAHGSDGRMVRAYLALCWGVPERRRGSIEARIGRSSTNRTKMAVVTGEGGRHAVTHYEVLRTFVGQTGRPVASLLRLVLETGRTHQIRVHLAHIGHPILDDAVYGTGFKASVRLLSEAAQASLEQLGRQALHAAVLGFDHPVTGKHLLFESPLPAGMARFVEALSEAPEPPPATAARRSSARRKL